MKIRLNGADYEAASSAVAGLLEELRLPRQAVLVERNGQPLDRSEWDSISLREGDSLEILRISAGG